MNNKINIVSLVSKLLRESDEPFFYLAPEIIGSVNNPVHNKEKGLIILKLNLIDGDEMDMVVSDKCYNGWKESNLDKDPSCFVNDFLNGSKPIDEFDNSDSLHEIIDEYGELYNINQDVPINTGSNPGFSNKQSGEKAIKKYATNYQRMYSNYGYGAVVW